MNRIHSKLLHPHILKDASYPLTSQVPIIENDSSTFNSDIGLYGIVFILEYVLASLVYTPDSMFQQIEESINFISGFKGSVSGRLACTPGVASLSLEKAFKASCAS